MKRYLSPQLFAAFLLVLTLAGCQSDSSKPESGTPADSTANSTAEPASSTGTRYSWKMEPGFSWKIKSLETYTTVTNPGAKNESRSVFNVTINRKANLKELDKEMAMNIGITYQDIVKSEGEPGKNEKGKPTVSDPNDPRLGKSITVRLEPSTGQILDVRGADAIFRGSGMESLAEIGNALYREAINKEFYIYPDGPVEVGASWKRSGRLRYPYGLNVNETYTLEKQMGGQGFIKRVSDLREGDKVPGVEPSFSLNGSATADFNVDDATGLIFSKVENTVLEGTMTKDGIATPVRIEIAAISEMTMQ